MHCGLQPFPRSTTEAASFATPSPRPIPVSEEPDTFTGLAWHLMKETPEGVYGYAIQATARMGIKRV